MIRMDTSLQQTMSHCTPGHKRECRLCVESLCMAEACRFRFRFRLGFELRGGYVFEMYAHEQTRRGLQVLFLWLLSGAGT